MTYYEKLIATAYTGTMFIHGGQLGDLYEYIERASHSGAIDLNFACDEFNEYIKDLTQADFLIMLEGLYANVPTPEWCRYENVQPITAPDILHIQHK